MDKLLKKDNLKPVGRIDDSLSLYLFKPNLLKLFPKSGNMHEMNIKQKVRFLLLLVHGYKVYVVGDDAHNAVACAVFASGKAGRYPFACEQDLICGPYFVVPEYRKKGSPPKCLDSSWKTARRGIGPFSRISGMRIKHPYPVCKSWDLSRSIH